MFHHVEPLSSGLSSWAFTGTETCKFVSESRLDVCQAGCFSRCVSPHPSHQRSDGILCSRCVCRPGVGERAARLPVFRSGSHVWQQAGCSLGVVEEDARQDLPKWGMKGSRSYGQVCLLMWFWLSCVLFSMTVLRRKMCVAGICGRITWCSLRSTTWRPRWGSIHMIWAWTSWETWWGTCIDLWLPFLWLQRQMEVRIWTREQLAFAKKPSLGIFSCQNRIFEDRVGRKPEVEATWLPNTC